MKSLKKSLLSAAVVTLSFGSLFSSTILAEETTVEEAKKEEKKEAVTKIEHVEHGQTPKNIIVLIADGAGPSFTSAYRIFKNGKAGKDLPMSFFDPYLVGQLMTHPFQEDPTVTDSAAAGTAMATGHKTINGQIGMDSEGNAVDSILDIAKQKGKATGLVATSTITHATPAAYGATVEDRNNEAGIADNYFDDKINDQAKIDVLLGGGLLNFKRDDRDLTKEFVDAGFDFVQNKEELLKSEKQQVLGLFAEEAMAPELDRPENEPALAEMTDAAIKKLSQDEEGFFLMVEGSQVDWAGHAEDPVYAMTDMAAYEKAVEVAMNFAKENGETLVISTADHETGGLVIGQDYMWDPTPIKQMKKTTGFIAKEMAETKDVDGTLKKYVEFELTSDEKSELENALLPGGEGEEGIAVVLTKAVNTRSYTGWGGKGSHTAVDPNVYAFGPGYEKYLGLVDNTEFAKIMFEFFGGKVSEAKKAEETTVEETKVDEITAEETTVEETTAA